MRRPPTVSAVSITTAPPTPDTVAADLAADWAQAAAEVSRGAEAALVLPDGTAAVLMPAVRATELHERLARAEETATFLRTRHSRRNVTHGLRDAAAGRTGTLDSLGAALARHR